MNIFLILLKLLTETVLAFFHLGYNKSGYFDDGIIASVVRSDMAM